MAKIRFLFPLLVSKLTYHTYFRHELDGDLDIAVFIAILLGLAFGGIVETVLFVLKEERAWRALQEESTRGLSRPR